MFYGIKPRCYWEHFEELIWEQFGNLGILWETNGNSQDGECSIAGAGSSWPINETRRKNTFMNY
jgi:hypothetical protein